MALALPLLALGAWFAVHRGVAPLRRLGRALAERAPAGAARRSTLDDAPAEMAPLVEALNGLFGRIGALLDAERRFTADAAHELRTPIAAIRAQAQVALGESDDAPRRHALEQTLEGCDRATRLVEQLLTLSRLEAESAPALAPLELAPLARRVAAELAPRALGPAPGADARRGRELARDGRGNAARRAAAQPARQRRALQPGRRAHRGGAAARGRPRRVLGRGQRTGPVADADRARLGERFFRVPGSGASGSGLGWSIARRIAAVHGLELQTGRSAALGGLAVRVAWPPAPPLPPA